MATMILLPVAWLLLASLVDGKFNEGEVNRLQQDSGGVVGKNDHWRPGGLFCQNLVGYYEGVFKNKARPASTYPAQFQLRMASDLSAKQYQLTVEGWNETVSQHTEFIMYYDYRIQHKWCDDITVGKTCSSPFGQYDNYFSLYLDHGPGDNAFHLIFMDPFNRTFSLYDTVDKCTNITPNLPDAHDDWVPDPTSLNFCVCCDHYSPSSKLNCPKSPWA